MSNTPIENIKTIQKQISEIRKNIIELENKLHDYDDKNISIKTIDYIEKIETEIKFLEQYEHNLENQIVVIMNENDVIIS